MANTDRINYRQPRANQSLSDYGNVAALRLVKSIFFPPDNVSNNQDVKSISYFYTSNNANPAHTANKLAILNYHMAGEHLRLIAPTFTAYAATIERFNLPGLPTIATFPAFEVDMDNSRNYTMSFKSYVGRIGAVYGISPQLLLSAWVTLMTAMIHAQVADFRHLTIGQHNVSVRDLIPMLPTIMGASPAVLDPSYYATSLEQVPTEMTGIARSRSRRKSNKKKKRSRWY